MRLQHIAAAWTAVGILCAQDSVAPLAKTAPPSIADLALEDPSVLRAKLNVERIRALVDSGTLPRARLEKAEMGLLDAQDEAILTRAIYGRDLTREQAEETVNAAQRRLDRRQKAADEQKKLVDAGVISTSEMVASLEDVDRASKDLDWAKARSELVRQIENMASAEAALMRQLETLPPAESGKLVERYDGKGIFDTTDLTRIEAAFMAHFAKPLPISANGQTAVHRALGFNHTGRVDVALTPSQPEGAWLRHYLIANRIPFIAFRTAIAHQATGAHIHLGPPSTRYVPVLTSATGSP